MMRTIQLKYFLFPIVILMVSCTTKTEFKRLEIWEEIQVAVREKNIDYLLQISKDTLECIECNNGEDWISKEDFFLQHPEQMKVSKNKMYSYFADIYEDEKGYNKRYRINYAYKKYNTIYIILEGEKGIQFNGVFGVP